MKHHNQKSYQYPVIRTNSEDYINESFSVDHKVSIDNVNIQISINYSLSSNEIKQEILNRNASYVSVIRCKDTFYSKSINTKSSTDFIEIDSGELRGTVEVQSFVIAQKNVIIKSNNLNDDYRLFLTNHEEEGDEIVKQFTYNRGDMIALTNPYIFAIDREYFKPLQSCIDITEDPKQKEGKWEIDITEDHLKIIVSPEMYELWLRLKQGDAGKSALINSLYFSAVTYAIKCLQDDPEMKYSHKWADVIFSKISNLGINIDSEEDYKITNQLLDYPLPSLESISHEY